MAGNKGTQIYKYTFTDKSCTVYVSVHNGFLKMHIHTILHLCNTANYTELSSNSYVKTGSQVAKTRLSVQLHSEVPSRAQTALAIVSSRENSDGSSKASDSSCPLTLNHAAGRTKPHSRRCETTRRFLIHGGARAGKGAVNTTWLSYPCVIVD